jgi:hypothetical protein
VTIGSRKGVVLLLFYLKFRTPRNGKLEFSASWRFHVRADAVGVLEKLQLYLGYSYITDFSPVFEYFSPQSFMVLIVSNFFKNNGDRNVFNEFKCKKILGLSRNLNVYDTARYVLAFMP